ncbi:isopeptide-forming domain-containing fimbrial protein [uncultured Sphingopyxis sp.]|uniref:beta strand repeat-containing protein n=1 Tax=uncultured Sphingopyxis sp. TaxID=310581 RepID=UPI0025EAE09E|nr:isopeptide-forming domain-containing fimbrial protein [uncultured Sphingopyxis sp.]
MLADMIEALASACWPSKALKRCIFGLVLCLGFAIPALAQQQVPNAARISLSSGAADNDPANDESTAIVNVTPLPAVTYTKAVSAPGTAVNVGDTLSYTLTATVSNSATLNVLTLTDTLGPGLDFGAVTNAGAFTCNAANPLICTLPAGTAPGTYSLTYTATVNATATTFVSNAVVGTGDDNPTCVGACDTDTPVADPTVTFAKTTGATSVAIGDTISYTLSATVANSQTTGIVTLTDTLGVGLDFGAVVNAGIFTCNAANPLVCTLPAGTAPGTYSVTYTAIVNASASGSVTNAVLGSGPDDPSCTTNCGTDTPLVPPAVSYSKGVSAPGATVSAGDVLTYTLTANVTNSPTTAVLTLTDTLSAGLDFTAITNSGAFACNPATPLVCTLPAGTAPGAYSLTYTATVNAGATGTVNNAVVGTGGDNPTCAGTCTTTTPVADPAITYAKSTNATQVKVGDVISYTLTATITNSATTGVLTLTDTLGTGLDFTAVTDAGAFTCNAANPLVCTLPAGTAVGTYSLTYTATVNASATGTVSNAVLGSGPDNPTCTGDCDIDTPVIAPAVSYAKTANTAGPVSTGDVITFTLTTTVANSQTTSDIVLLTDTLGTGLDFTAVVSAGAYTVDASGAPIVRFTLPAGSGPGTYSVVYTATVNAAATGTVSNVVVGSGGDNPTCTTQCGTDTPVADTGVTYSKSVSAPGATVSAGDVLTYTLTARVTNSPTTAVMTLTDTLSAGLDFTAVTNAGIFTCNAANPLVCTMPAGTAVGTYSLTYTATVNAGATGTVDNAVVGTGGDNPTCAGTCTTTTPVADPVVTYAKSANAAQVKVGDVISYTLTATIANSATTGVLTLTDTLGTGLDFTAVTDAGAFTCPIQRRRVC